MAVFLIIVLRMPKGLIIVMQVYFVDQLFAHLATISLTFPGLVFQISSVRYVLKIIVENVTIFI